MGGVSDAYMANLASENVGPISAEQELEYVRQYRAGNPNARKELIKSCLRLVIDIALRDFHDFYRFADELVSEGNIGLMGAVDRYDPAKGARLGTYAVDRIKQKMRQWIADNGKTVRINARASQKVAEVLNCRNVLSEKLGRDATAEEIAEELGMWQSSVRAYLNTGRVGEKSGFVPYDVPNKTSKPSILEEYGDVDVFALMDACLDEQEKMILSLRFGLDGNKPHRLEDVAQMISRTRERVRQVQNRALAKLRSELDLEERTEQYVGVFVRQHVY